MKRLLDIFLASFLMIVTAPLTLLICIGIKLTSPGPIIYCSKRVGKHNVIFQMPKFRTMTPDAPALASRHFKEPENYLTPLGPFLRKTSLDEIPQLWSILKGDMSFVGPRPVLPEETDLLSLRTKEGVHRLSPGLTGWAQINGRDFVSVDRKVTFDKEYLVRQSFFFDLMIILKTIPKVLFKSDITH